MNAEENMNPPHITVDDLTLAYENYTSFKT